MKNIFDFLIFFGCHWSELEKCLKKYILV